MTEMTPLALAPETLAELRRLYEAAFTVAAPENEWEEWTSKAAEAFPALLDAAAELAAQRTVRLPTVAECRQARKDVLIDNWDWHASAVLDLVASLNPTWVEVPADATIPNDTLVRQEWEEMCVGVTKTRSYTAPLSPADRASWVRWFVPSGTVLIQPVDPRIEAAAKAIHAADQQDGDEQRWDTDTDAIRDTYMRLAKAAIDALGEDI